MGLWTALYGQALWPCPRTGGGVQTQPLASARAVCIYPPSSHSRLHIEVGTQ